MLLSDLAARLDDLSRRAVKVTQQAHALASRGKAEAPGLFVVRHPGNLSARLKKQVLLHAEERAAIMQSEASVIAELGLVLRTLAALDLRLSVDDDEASARREGALPPIDIDAVVEAAKGRRP